MLKSIFSAPGLLGLLAVLATCSERSPAPDNPALVSTVAAPLSSFDCTQSTATGYVSGNPFTITVVHVDSKPVEVETANAYYVMARAAERDGVQLRVVSGFRTYEEQQYLRNCYLNCNCNNCNLAAPPGYSNHQSGHALDLNTATPGVYNWLARHAGAYGFTETVSGEPWHWEWWGGGPGGGICGTCQPRCEGDRIIGADCGEGDCAAFGGICVHPPGEDPKCGQACTPRCEGSVIVSRDCSRGDCGVFGATCIQPPGEGPRCGQPCTPRCDGDRVVGSDCSVAECNVFGLTCIAPSGVPQCGQACTPSCNGSVAIGADCGTGDCGAFGATCVMEGGAPRCRLPCQPRCEGTKRIDAFCNVTECAGDAGGTCVLEGDEGGNINSKCVSTCTSRCDGTVAVRPDCGRVDCADSGQHCVVNSVNIGAECGAAPACTHGCDGTKLVMSSCATGDCAAFGLTCADLGLGPQCVVPICTPQCQGSFIVDDTCQMGNCGAFGLTCSTAGGTPPHCVSPFCVEDVDEIPQVHDICLGGKVFRCNAQGLPIELAPQPEEVCNRIDDDCDGDTDEGVTNACGSCGEPPVEVCNRLDDDCDGDTDEGVTNACGTCGLAPPERCNGIDDDCDGDTDEDFVLGDPCTVGQGACATGGTTACSQSGELTICVSDATPCDDDDPCTEDTCEAGACTHQKIVACCADGRTCPEGLTCADGRCRAQLCSPCRQDADCGDGACVGYPFGTGCATPCGGQTDCPEGFVCTRPDDTQTGFCVADADRCPCGPATGARRCVGDDLVALDACGNPAQVVTTCERGCVRDACVGTDPLDVVDGDSDGDTATPPGDAGPGGEPDTSPASGADTGAATGSSKSDGCAGSSGSDLPLALLALVALGWVTTGRRRGGAAARRAAPPSAASSPLGRREGAAALLEGLAGVDLAAAVGRGRLPDEVGIGAAGARQLE